MAWDGYLSDRDMPGVYWFEEPEMEDPANIAPAPTVPANWAPLEDSDCPF